MNITTTMLEVQYNVNCVWMDTAVEGSTVHLPIEFSTDGFQHLLKLFGNVVYDSENDPEMNEDEMMAHVHNQLVKFTQSCQDLINY